MAAAKENVVDMTRKEPKNLPEIERRVREAKEVIEDTIKTKRAELNAEKKKQLSALEADFHLNPAAVEMAMKRAGLTEERQAGFDLTYDICCKAFGVNPQMELPVDGEGDE